MVKLTALQPTAEEIETARAVLSGMSEKELRARKGSLNYFIKQHLAANENAVETRGKDRDAILENFDVHQMRSKAAKKEASSSRTVTKTKAKHEEIHRWSTEKMKLEVGSFKAQKWIDSGKLAWTADPITGEDDVAMREWHIPITWTAKTSADEAQSSLVGKEDIVGKDGYADFKEAFSLADVGAEDAADTTSTANSEIKSEEKEVDPEDATKKSVQAFKKSVGITLRKWQDSETTLTRVIFSAGEAKYTPEAFVGDAKQAESQDWQERQNLDEVGQRRRCQR